MNEGKDPVEVTEKYVLGSIIDLGLLPLDNDPGDPGNQVLNLCRKYGVSEKSFSNAFAGKIYSVMDELNRDGLKCDAATVRVRLGDDPELKGERGAANLAYFDSVLGEGDDGSRGNGTYEYHIKVLRARELQRIGLAALNRGICRLTSLTARDLYDLNYVRMIMGDVERDIFKANERISQPVNMEQAYEAAAAELIKEMDGPQAISGLLTGYQSLDKTLFGMKSGDLLILAARPSVGKTTLAMNIAMNVAKADKRVLFVSLEMGSTALAKRILAGEVAYDSLRAKGGCMGTEERKRLEEKIKAAKAAYMSRKLIINDQVGHEIGDVRALARREKRNEGGLDLVIVDYLQLMESREYARQNNRQLVVGHISGQLKQMALELECPVLVLSQLSRNNESREDKRPQLSDLRDSGAIEQDADVVILLSDPNKGKGKETATDNNLSAPKPISVNIAKNRNGSVREDIQLKFYGDYTMFKEP